jgi:hypothetical protein
LIVPGFCFASSTRSASDFTGNAVFTTITFDAVATRETGMKSFTASYGRSLRRFGRIA